METYACKDNIGSVRRWRLYNKTALHPYDPAALMYRAPYRMHDRDSTRWTIRDPLGMVDGPNMYVHVSDDIIQHNDYSGLYQCTELSGGDKIEVKCIDAQSKKKTIK